jgi:2Fe-2S ferredoxin
MPKIVIKNLNYKSIDSVHENEKMLDLLLRETDWMHACGGKGRCTTCRAIILQGNENLSESSMAEQRFASLNRLRDNERLTCQVFVHGDVEIKVPEPTKLPHLNYSD